jgi:hypothetical protein
MGNPKNALVGGQKTADAQAKLARIEMNKRAERLENVNQRFENLTLADQQMLGRITGVIVQADVDIMSLKQQEQQLHEELKRTPLYKKLLAVREQMKWARQHKNECTVALKKISEIWDNPQGNGSAQLMEGV